MKSAFILIFLVLAISGCAPKDPVLETAAVPHADPGSRLRTIMESINRNIEDDTDTGAIPGTMDAERSAQLIEAVEELIYYAELMSSESPPWQLDSKDIVTFRALASQLYTEALNVRTYAEASPATTYDFNLLIDAHERLYETCGACHGLFRDR